MPFVDLVDETYLVADPATVAAVVGDPARWRQWWPGLELTVVRDRGVRGRQWAVSGEWSGTAEIWLEPYGDGVILHLYLRLDPVRAGSRLGWRLRSRRTSRARADRERRRFATAWKPYVWALKDALEAGRPPGTPRLRGGPRASE